MLHQAHLKKPPWLSKNPLPKVSRYGYLIGMKGDQITYATQASESAEIGPATAQILMDNYFHGEERLYIAFDDNNFTKLKIYLDIQENYKGEWKGNVKVHFELKHSYFRNMEKALKKLPEEVIGRLIPEESDFDSDVEFNRIPFPKHYDYLRLDQHQFRALQAVVFSRSNAPILIAGPFGTGKTRLLATAAYYFLEECRKPVRVLVSAHHQASADTFMDCYFALMKMNPRHPWRVNLTRLTPSESYHNVNHEYSKWFKTVYQFKKLHLYHEQKRLLVVTTFLTALRLCDLFPSGYFTHILLDEGAQTREPEAIAPLCLADSNTKIVIAGDHCQVR